MWDETSYRTDFSRLLLPGAAGPHQRGGRGGDVGDEEDNKEEEEEEEAHFSLVAGGRYISSLGHAPPHRPASPPAPLALAALPTSHHQQQQQQLAVIGARPAVVAPGALTPSELAVRSTGALALRGGGGGTGGPSPSARGGGADADGPGSAVEYMLAKRRRGGGRER